MKKLIFIAAGIIAISAISSCRKYLDKKSSTGITVPTNLGDMQALLDFSYYMNKQRSPGFSDASSDNYFLLQSRYESRDERNQAMYRWIPFDNYGYPNDWSEGYTPTYTANFVLEGIQLIPVDSDNREAWENVKGSALFYRAYYFLQLAWTFSKAYDESTAQTEAGIALRTTSDFNVASTRASVKDTYAKIIADAMESVPLLTNIPAHTYRPSKGAAYGLLARTYLSMRQYDSALKYVDLCLQIKSQLMDFKGDPDITGSLSGEETPFRDFNKEILFYSETNLQESNLTGPSSALIDTLLYQSYDANDLRKEAYFFPKNGYYCFKGYYSGSTIIFSGIATDEMFLTRAECLARKGDKTGALQDLNTLLAKRYDASFVPVTASDAGEALATILTERRKELLFRGLRLTDIKRLNKEGANIIPTRLINGQTYTIPPNDNRYAMPLPLDIINQSGMQQNPY